MCNYVNLNSRFAFKFYFEIQLFLFQKLYNWVLGFSENACLGIYISLLRAFQFEKDGFVDISFRKSAPPPLHPPPLLSSFLNNHWNFKFDYIRKGCWWICNIWVLWFWVFSSPAGSCDFVFTFPLIWRTFEASSEKEATFKQSLFALAFLQELNRAIFVFISFRPPLSNLS